MSSDRLTISARRLGCLPTASFKGDDLVRITALVDFAMSRVEFERAMPRADGAEGGRPAVDHMLTFKILLLQAMHGLSEGRCEYLITDRLWFMRFLGLELADPVPHANTIWAFREALKRAGAVERLVAHFDATLRVSTPAEIWPTLALCAG